jgi:hypothetical protein
MHSHVTEGNLWRKYVVNRITITVAWTSVRFIEIYICQLEHHAQTRQHFILDIDGHQVENDIPLQWVRTGGGGGAPPVQKCTGGSAPRVKSLYPVFMYVNLP